MHLNRQRKSMHFPTAVEHATAHAEQGAASASASSVRREMRNALQTKLSGGPVVGKRHADQLLRDARVAALIMHVASLPWIVLQIEQLAALPA